MNKSETAVPVQLAALREKKHSSKTGCARNHGSGRDASGEAAQAGRARRACGMSGRISSAASTSSRSTSVLYSISRSSSV